MTTARFPDAGHLRERVQQVLDEFLARQDKALAAVSPDLGSLMATVTELLRGGKRLRSAFC